MSRAGVTRTVNKVQKVRENKTEQGQTWPCRSRNVFGSIVNIGKPLERLKQEKYLHFKMITQMIRGFCNKT